MKHLFIPYELAVLAKDNGFNEPCIGMYLENKNLYSLSNPTSDFSFVTNENRQDTFAAPLYQQIVDWFRENHSIKIIEESQNGFGIYECYDSTWIQTLECRDLKSAIEEAFNLIKK